jgi:meiosis induction protein kinase IME2/SME1
MLSPDVRSIGGMSSISFATVDSDPGPSRLRSRPGLFGISRRTSRSSLRTSFDDFPPSARRSNFFFLEGQLAHNFRTQASPSALQNPLDLNGQLPPLPGLPPISGHTLKSAIPMINPRFKVVSYKWDPTSGLVPDDSMQPPLPPPPTDYRSPSQNALPPFSELEAVAAGEYPPLSPMDFTTPEQA